MTEGRSEMAKALAEEQTGEDWPYLAAPALFCRGFEQGQRHPAAENLSLVGACGLVSTMDEFATTETPLLWDFVKKVLTLLAAEANQEHLLGMPCWCGPERIEVHGSVELGEES